jgi:nucleotide-binding universal stress UspA family protein
MVAFKEVLVPTDFSEYSVRAVDYGVEIAGKFASHITLVHVVEPLLQAADLTWTTVDFEELNREQRAAAREQLDKLAGDRIPKGIACDAVILFGKAFVEIVRCARERNADLIVMATHGRGAISHLLLGSTAEKVVRKATCPVLTVKHPKHVFSMP